jgi:hypothetical protein
MDALNALAGSYSLEDVFFFFIAAVILVKTVGQAWEWMCEKVRTHVLHHSSKDVAVATVESAIGELRETLGSINDKVSGISDRLDCTDASIAALQEHQLQVTRAYFVEKYYYYSKELGAIDENGLQVLEVRYAFYKAHGGNSYIDSLMEELRELPRISVYDTHVMDALKHEGVVHKNG